MRYNDRAYPRRLYRLLKKPSRNCRANSKLARFKNDRANLTRLRQLLFQSTMQFRLSVIKDQGLQAPGFWSYEQCGLREERQVVLHLFGTLDAVSEFIPVHGQPRS